jgi:hypothetical protein
VVVLDGVDLVEQAVVVPEQALVLQLLELTVPVVVVVAELGILVVLLEQKVVTEL